MSFVDVLNVIVISVSVCSIAYSVFTLIRNQIRIAIKKMIIEELNKFDE